MMSGRRVTNRRSLSSPLLTDHLSPHLKHAKTLNRPTELRICNLLRPFRLETIELTTMLTNGQDLELYYLRS